MALFEKKIKNHLGSENTIIKTALIEIVTIDHQLENFSEEIDYWWSTQIVLLHDILRGWSLDFDVHGYVLDLLCYTKKESMAMHGGIFFFQIKYETTSIF